MMSPANFDGIDCDLIGEDLSCNLPRVLILPLINAVEKSIMKTFVIELVFVIFIHEIQTSTEIIFFLAGIFLCFEL